MKTVVTTPPITTISSATLVDIMLNRKGTTFVRLNTRTEPKMNKRENPLFGNVVKDSEIVALIGFDYQNLVNNARTRESMTELAECLAEATGITVKEAKERLESLRSEVSENRENFEPKPRKWGEHMTAADGTVSKTMIIHKGNHYLQVCVLHTKTPVYRYADSGEVLSEADLETAKSFMRKKTSNAAHQGLEQEKIIRDYKVQNVRQIKLNKTEYVVNDTATVVLYTVSPETAQTV